MNETLITRARAAILVAAPAVLIVGFAYHPHIGSPIDAGFVARLAAAVAADPVRWGIAHLVVAVGSGLMILAFVAVRSLLREAGEERWSGVGLPFVVMGSTLYALLPAMEFAPLAAAVAGSDVAAAQEALAPWFLPTLLAGAALFTIGTVAFAAAAARADLPGPGLARFVAAALVLMGLARFVPIAAVQFWVHGAAACAALWPIALAAVRRGEVAVAGRGTAVPAP